MAIEAASDGRWRFAPSVDVTHPRVTPQISAEIEGERTSDRRHRICKNCRAMKMHTNTGVDDREQWRARIQRALQELQGEDGVSAGRLRRDANPEETAAESAKL